MGPNKATSLVWGQWDLNIAGKWVQPLENDFLLLGTIQKPDRAEVFHAEGNARLWTNEIIAHTVFKPPILRAQHLTSNIPMWAQGCVNHFWLNVWAPSSLPYPS
jgi:hypothetical protein